MNPTSSIGMQNQSNLSNNINQFNKDRADLETITKSEGSGSLVKVLKDKNTGSVTYHPISLNNSFSLLTLVFTVIAKFLHLSDAEFKKKSTLEEELKKRIYTNYTSIAKEVLTQVEEFPMKYGTERPLPSLKYDQESKLGKIQNEFERIGNIYKKFIEIKDKADPIFTNKNEAVTNELVEINKRFTAAQNILNKIL